MLLEKPFTTDVNEAHELCAAAKVANDVKKGSRYLLVKRLYTPAYMAGLGTATAQKGLNVHEGFSPTLYLAFQQNLSLPLTLSLHFPSFFFFSSLCMQPHQLQRSTTPPTVACSANSPLRLARRSEKSNT